MEGLERRMEINLRRRITSRMNREVGSGRHGCKCGKVRVLPPSIACTRRLACPMHALVTMRELLGCKVTAVRHYRGALGKRGSGGTVNPPRNRKGETGNPLPTAHAAEFYPNQLVECCLIIIRNRDDSLRRGGMHYPFPA